VYPCAPQRAADTQGIDHFDLKPPNPRKVKVVWQPNSNAEPAARTAIRSEVALYIDTPLARLLPRQRLPVQRNLDRARLSDIGPSPTGNHNIHAHMPLQMLMLPAHFAYGGIHSRAPEEIDCRDVEAHILGCSPEINAPAYQSHKKGRSCSGSGKSPSASTTRPHENPCERKQ
jgi:hypothetical protein